MEDTDIKNSEELENGNKDMSIDEFVSQAKDFIDLIKNNQNICIKYREYVKTLKHEKYRTIFNIIFFNELIDLHDSAHIQTILNQIINTKEYKCFLQYIDIDAIKKMDNDFAPSFWNYINKISAQTLTDDEKEKLKSIKNALKEKNPPSKNKKGENEEATNVSKDNNISENSKEVKNKNSDTKSSQNDAKSEKISIFSQIINNVQSIEKKYKDIQDNLSKARRDISDRDKIINEQTDRIKKLEEECRQTISDNKNKKDKIKQQEKEVTDLKGQIEQNNKEITSKNNEIMDLKNDITNWKKANENLQNSQDYNKEVFIAQITRQLKSYYNEYVKYKDSNDTEALKIMLDNVFTKLEYNGIIFKEND